MGILPTKVTQPEDWQYLDFTPTTGAEFRHISGDLYEQVIVRDDLHHDIQGVFAIFRDIEEFSTKDLYSKNPTKPGLWLHRGRLDDIIVFSNGEKLDPLPMEDSICSNPLVSHALVAGTAESQSSLLVEPKKHPVGEAEIEDIWESVQKANKLAPSNGCIHRNMIIFTDSDKPMLRAGKGTVQRKLTLDQYSTELEHLYLQDDPIMRIHDHVGSQEHDDVVSSIKRILSEASEIDGQTTALDANLLEIGLDLLQVIVIARELKMPLLMKGREQSIAPKDVNAHLTIRKLADLVIARIEGRAFGEEAASVSARMKAVYDALHTSLPVSARAIVQAGGQDVVLLTGSTGSLGSYLLDTLLQDSKVYKIYCLNRGPNSKAGQERSHVSKGFRTSLNNVHFLTADYGKPFFGLSQPIYRDILTKVTKVIHNAWQVDWHLDFDAFTDQLKTVRQLIDFSAQSQFGAHIFFISSIASVENYGKRMHSTARIPEEVFDDWAISQNAGYGQSKLVAERLLDAAAHEAGIPATILRLGQIAGPTTSHGEWPQHEWLPALIASSKYLGKIPHDLGTMNRIDWIPVDKAADVIRELTIGVRSSLTSGSTAYHLVNPAHTDWSVLAETIRYFLKQSTGIQIEKVSLQDSIEALCTSAPSAQDLKVNPAGKFIDFFEGLIVEDAKPVRLKTDRAVQDSSILAGMKPISVEMMKNWMRQWEKD